MPIPANFGPRVQRSTLDQLFRLDIDISNSSHHLLLNHILACWVVVRVYMTWYSGLFWNIGFFCHILDCGFLWESRILPVSAHPRRWRGPYFVPNFQKKYVSKLASLYNDGGTDDICGIIRNILGPLLSKYVKLVLFDSIVYPITWMSLAWTFCFVVLSIIHVSIEFSIDMGAGRFWCPTRSHP